MSLAQHHGHVKLVSADLCCQ